MKLFPHLKEANMKYHLIPMLTTIIHTDNIKPP